MQQKLWKTLLELTRLVHNTEEAIQYCCMDYSTEKSKIAVNELLPGDKIITAFFSSPFSVSPSSTVFHFKSKLSPQTISKGLLDDETLLFLKSYLPYCFLSIYARQQKSTIAVAHFAQSLDGRIATSSGDSRWIGNDENLDHAHRMRALCDAILVGNNTILADKPKLTVRRVVGNNPIRVVLGSTSADYSSLMDCCADPVLLLSSSKLPSNGHLRSIQLTSNNGRIKSRRILDCLYKEGINTVYIEGGAITTSNFINDRAIDILQLHLSPLLFGSGKLSIVLPEIADVNGAIQFENFHFQSIGDTVMFVGQMHSQ